MVSARKSVVLGSFAVTAALGGVLLAYSLQHNATTGNDPECFAQSRADLSSKRAPLHSVRRDATRAKIAIALDDYVGIRRHGYAFVRLVATPGNRSGPLPKNTRVGATVLGDSLTDGTRDIGVPVVARATRSRDGRGIDVHVCARRSEQRSEARPGRYRGLVRVSGFRIESGDIPVIITIKGGRTSMFFIALGIAMLGAALTASGAKPADVNPTTVRDTWIRHITLALLPLLSGVAAGVVAGFTIYLDDPTWGANRGDDIAKLVAVVFAAASAGLAVTAPPARVTRQRIAPPAPPP